MNYFIFDIETGTSDNADLFQPEFEASKVLKDPEKVTADIVKKKIEWQERTPLSALTGKILCIGYKVIGLEAEFIWLEENEKKIINEFWRMWQYHEQKDTLFIGHNIFNFDLPYLIRRSWINGIKPPNLFNKRYWNENIKDTMEIWNSNQYPKEMISLKNLAKVLGVGDKTDDGKRFGELWINDREKAIAYLKNDLNLISQIYPIIK